jgi:hypothetical protein
MPGIYVWFRGWRGPFFTRRDALTAASFYHRIPLLAARGFVSYSCREADGDYVGCA